MTLVVLFSLVATALANPVVNTYDPASYKSMSWTLPVGKTMEEKLAFEMLKDYNKDVNPTGRTEVKIGISFLCSAVDKRDHMINTRVLEKTMWMDERLKWNPTQFNNIKKINLPAHRIWKPDMKLFNSEKHEEMIDNVNVMITYDGKVTYMPLITYKTHCIIDHTGTDVVMEHRQRGNSMGIQGSISGVGTDLKSDLFGMRQKSSSSSEESSSSSSSSSSSEERYGKTGRKNMLTCKLMIGSWTYDDKKMKLNLEGQGLDKTFYSEMCPYEVNDMKVKIKDNVFPEVPDEKYPAMIIDFKMKHRMM